MDTKIITFKDLIAWQKAMELARGVYAYTLKLPKEEMYGLSSQMRRAAISIPSNIAEGKKRKTRADFVHFLRMSHGSVAELETQLILSQDLYKIDSLSLRNLLDEVGRMLGAMIKKLEL